MDQETGSPVTEEVIVAEPEEGVEQEQNSAAAEDEVASQATDDASDEGEETTETTDEPKRKDGFQRRVEKLNAKAREAQLEAEFWKAKALGSQPAAAKAVEPAAEPKFSDFNDVEAYTNAMVDWKLERRLAELEQRQATRQVTYTHEQRLQEFVKTAPDFEEVLDNVEHVRFAPTTLEALATSDIGPQLMYELGKNPSEAERISRLHPVQQVKELGRIEERLASKKTAAATPKTETKAPAPLKPAAGKASVSKVDITDPNLDFAAFKRAREEQLKARQRR